MGLLCSILLAACGGNAGEQPTTPTSAPFWATLDARLTRTPVEEEATPDVPLVDLALSEDDVFVGPQPLRAGFPFTITAVLHNRGQTPVVDVPLVLHMFANQEKIGYVSFFKTLTVTLPASQSLPVDIPVHWNFAGGEHQLQVQLNRLPEAWASYLPALPEDDTSDNMAFLDLMVDPFDAYSNDLCPGRVDAEITPSDILPEPAQQRVSVWVHNPGNRAIYNLPVIVIGEQLTGIAYTPAIPPCGGTAQVYVELDRPIQQGESLSVQINPSDWAGALAEDDFDNNQVTVASGLAPGVALPPGREPADYDFSIQSSDISTPEPWIVLVTIQNLGTRDASMVPILVENEAGRQVTDAIPVVRGEGLGVAAIRVGYLWIPGGTLTFTVNPEQAKGAYPEDNRDNNQATFTLP